MLEHLQADLPRVYREIRALKKLHHQHISQMFEVIETRKMIFMIIEVREEEGEESGLVEIEGNENLWEGGKY